MPELPEVETVRNTLTNLVLNLEIKSALVYWDNIIAYPSVLEFKEKIKNQKINEILRKGKWLIFKLDDYYMLSHLRMEGKYFVNKKEIDGKHDHVVFNFKNGGNLIYNDTRKFGKIHLVKKENYEDYQELKKLGKEPFDIDFVDLFNKLKTKKIPIKQSLLDQSIMAGLGNIYVDEVLFLSKINPMLPSNKVTKKQAEDIVLNSILVLQKAIKLGGTTIRSYTSSLGVTGKFQNELRVHMREGKDCPLCFSKIIKTKVGQRGTYYCPKCQK